MDPTKKAPKLGKLTVESETGKLDEDLRRLSLSDPERMVSVIIKVAEDGYVPPAVTLRARMAPKLFTAQVRGRDLQRLMADAKVVSVAGAERLPLITPREA